MIIDAMTLIAAATTIGVVVFFIMEYQVKDNRNS